MRRRWVFLAAALVAWIVGATLGSSATRHPVAAGPLLQMGKVRAGFTPDLQGTDPIFILAIGSDARVEDGTPIEKGLGDSIHLIGVNAAKRRASILGFPRDSFVPTTCAGTGKINDALAAGGPACMVATVERLTGIQIDYWVLAGFDGVKNAVDEIGRLTIDIPFSMHDSFAKSDFRPGTQDLKGFDVLAFSRDRHSFSAGDFARSENQGRVLLAALEQFREEFADEPSRLFDWIGVGWRNIATSMSLAELLDFGFAATAFDPEKVQNMVVPGTMGTASDASIVNITSEANGIYADMKKDAIVAKRNVPRSPTAGE
jgi:LCP family protein required for cell wall assembly